MKGDRIASLKENLTISIERLEKPAAFNIIDYGGDVEVLDPDGPTTSKRTGIRRVEEMDMSLYTRCFCATRQAFLLPEIDTIYFLSDGAPARDSVSGWTQIDDAVLILTRYCPVAIFCIDFDPTPRNKAAMEKLAEWNVGLHESIAVAPVEGNKPQPRKGKRVKGRK
jgi:hypothetical protein